MVEKIEEIPRVLQLAEEVPFVGQAFRARLVAPNQVDGDGELEVEFIYDAEVDA